MNLVAKMFSPTTLIDGFRGWTVNAYLWLLAATATVIGLSLYWNETPLGMLSAITGIVCVILVAQGKLANYAFGLINVILYGWIAYQATYYGDAMLNWLFYLPLQFVGFYMWDRQERKVDKDTVSAKNMTWRQRLLLAVGAAVVVVGYSVVLESMGDALPLADSATTVLSIIAMVLMLYRFSEQWLCWIAVNIVSVGMWYIAFTGTGGVGIAALTMWCVFLANSIYGWWKWSGNRLGSVY